MIFTGKNGSIMISKSFLYLITKTSIFKCKNDLIIDTCAISGSFFVKRFGEEWFIALEHKIYKINDVDKFYDFLKSMENKLDHSLIAVFLFSSVPEVDDYTLIDYHIYKDIVYFIFKDGKRYIIYKNNEEFFIFPKLIFRFYKKHLFIVEDLELKKIYLKDKKKEVLRSNVYFNYLFINDEFLLGSCKNGSISIYKDKDVISFHKHAASLKEVLFIDDILYIITEDQKFSIVELKRNSRYDVFSFYGVFKKMYLYSNFILILTELELIKYNLRSGSIESWDFCIPKATNIKYCKEDCDEIYEDVLNEYKIKNFKAEVEAIYQRLDEDMYQVSNYKFSKKVKTDVNKITLVSRYKSFIFLYDSCIKYIFSIPKKELYYSNGFLLSLKSKKNKKITIDIYKILDNKLLYVTHRDTKLHKKPEEIYYINSTLFFLVDGRLYKNCIFITNLCILNNIKIIKECYKGIYALNNKGIYDLQINSYVKKSKNLSDFQFFKDDLYYLKDNTKLYCNGDLFLDDIGGHSFYINSKRIFIVASKDNHSEMSVYKNKVKKDSIHLNCDAEFCIRSDVIKTKNNLLYFIE